MFEAIETPYGLSSSFHPTRRETANGGPWGELELHASRHQEQAAAPVEESAQSADLGVAQRVGRAGDGDDPDL